MKKLLFGALILMTGFSFYSCNIINPDEPIPSYIKIDSFSIASTNPAYHGSVSDNITDAWVYVNSFNVGNFQLPATIPVLFEEGADSADIVIFGGIKNNGRSLSRRRYPFYVPYTGQLVKSTQTQNIVPVIQYRDSLNFLLKEDFETGNSFVPYNSPDTSMARTSLAPYLFEGSSSGLIYFDGIHRDAQVITVQQFQFSQNLESYLEVDYKCDIPFTLELQLVTPSSAVIVVDYLSVKASDDWNKIYINLTDIATNYFGSKVNFIIKAGLTPGQKSGFVAIDNFKIISQ